MYGGVKATTVTSTASQLTATFAKGVPSSEVDEVPKVVFYSSSYNSDHWSDFAEITATLKNPLNTPTGSAITCSYAGGCELSLTASGLSSQLEVDKA